MCVSRAWFNKLIERYLKRRLIRLVAPPLPPPRIDQATVLGTSRWQTQKSSQACFGPLVPIGDECLWMIIAETEYCVINKPPSWIHGRGHTFSTPFSHLTKPPNQHLHIIRQTCFSEMRMDDYREKTVKMKTYIYFHHCLMIKMQLYKHHQRFAIIRMEGKNMSKYIYIACEMNRRWPWRDHEYTGGASLGVVSRLSLVFWWWCRRGGLRDRRTRLRCISLPPTSVSFWGMIFGIDGCSLVSNR